MFPLVTVLMPNYNNEAFIREAIDSILNQTFGDFIFLIVDDGSTDKSVDIIKSYDDPRIRLIIKEKNSGIVDTLNLGLKAVETKYIVRMDGDDISAPDRIRLLVEFMEENPSVGVCGSNIKSFGDLNEVWKQELDRNKIKAKMIYCNGVTHAPSIFRTEVLKKNNIFYTNNHPYMEDYDLFFRMKGITDFAHIDYELYFYRILGHNSTVANKHTAYQRRKNFYVEVLKELGIEPSERNLDLHMQFFIGGVPLSFEMKDYREWMETILRSNREKRIYPEKEFLELFADAWNNFYYKVVPLSFKTNLNFFLVSKKISFHQLIYFLKFKFNSFTGRRKITWMF